MKLSEGNLIKLLSELGYDLPSVHTMEMAEKGWAEDWDSVYRGLQSSALFAVFYYRLDFFSLGQILDFSHEFASYFWEEHRENIRFPKLGKPLLKALCRRAALFYQRKWFSLVKLDFHGFGHVFIHRNSDLSLYEAISEANGMPLCRFPLSLSEEDFRKLDLVELAMMYCRYKPSSKPYKSLKLSLKASLERGKLIPAYDLDEFDFPHLDYLWGWMKLIYKEIKKNFSPLPKGAFGRGN